MFETIRKAMLIGLGAADLAAERVQQMVNDLVERGDMTTDQGKQLYTDIMSRMEERGRIENERMHTRLREAIRDMGVPDRSQMSMIEARMDALDRKIDRILDRLPKEEEVAAPGPVT
jgi:polyhydroxyalkanoate synthesis regulator phasin